MRTFQFFILWLECAIRLKVDVHLLLRLHVNLRTATALVALSGNNLVIVLSQVHAILCPSVEMILHVHAAADALSCANRPVLLKGPCAVDGGLVGAGGHGNVIGAAVGLEAALALRTAARVVCAVGFDHVVLHKRVASPAIYG